MSAELGVVKVKALLCNWMLGHIGVGFATFQNDINTTSSTYSRVVFYLIFA